MKQIIWITIFLIACLQANAICVVDGYTFGSSGHLLTTPVNLAVINTKNNVEYPVVSENGFYLKMLQSCEIGKDIIKVVGKDGYAAEGSRIADAPYTEINLTPEAGQSSSSGGGGATPATKPAPVPTGPCSSFTINNGAAFSIKKCDTGSYWFKGIKQEFSIVLIKENLVTGVFSPLNAPLAVYSGQEKEIDLDGNGLIDMKVRCAGIKGDSAVLTFILIAEKEVVEDKPIISIPKQIYLPAAAMTGLDMVLISLILVATAILIWLIYAVRQK